jgi:hypothetical protein
VAGGHVGSVDESCQAIGGREVPHDPSVPQNHIIRVDIELHSMARRPLRARCWSSVAEQTIPAPRLLLL